MSNIQGDGIRCLDCNDTVYSKHVHDFRSCKCGKCFVDGGKDYFRAGWTNRDRVEFVDKNGKVLYPEKES